jgi:hypothetical protein
MIDRNKYPILGYAPGDYFCICCICNQQFIGDKRAVHCEPCAVKGQQRLIENSMGAGI